MKEVNQFSKLKYIFSAPEGFDPSQKYPLIIFLHGAGSRGDNIEILKTNPFFIETDPFNLGAVIVAPQCYADSWFDIFEKLREFVVHCCNQEFVDKDRVYLIGASMGGYATWQLAMTMPETFAAIIPVCGGGMYWNAARLKNIKVWAFHGTLDTVVKYEESVKMVNAVNDSGGCAKLTTCEGVGHDSWNVAYGNRAVFEWLLSQSKESGTVSADNSFNNQEVFG